MNLKNKKRLDRFLGGVLTYLVKPLHFIIKNSQAPVVKKEIHIIKILGGGNLVIALPAMLGLRKSGIKINLITSKAVVPFAQTLGVFNKIFIVDDSSLVKLLLTSLAVTLRCFKVDTVVDLEVHSRLTGVLTLLTMAKQRVGLCDEKQEKVFYTDLVPFDPKIGRHEHYDSMAKVLNVVPVSMAECRGHLLKNIKPCEGEKSAIRKIGVGHACSELGRERMLKPRQWALFFKTRLDRNFQGEIHFFGAEDDRAVAVEIMGRIWMNYPKTTFYNHCGKLSLRQSVQKLLQVNEFWSIDSGLYHFARLLVPKTVSLWGPTEPCTRLRLVPGLDEEIIYQKISCSPCVHVVDTPTCEGDNICIKQLFDLRGLTNKAHAS